MLSAKWAYYFGLTSHFRLNPFIPTLWTSSMTTSRLFNRPLVFGKTKLAIRYVFLRRSIVIAMLSVINREILILFLCRIYIWEVLLNYWALWIYTKWINKCKTLTLLAKSYEILVIMTIIIIMIIVSIIILWLPTSYFENLVKLFLLLQKHSFIKLLHLIRLG